VTGRWLALCLLGACAGESDSGIGQPNADPVARADSAATVAGEVVEIEVQDNDEDPDGDRLVITEVTQPEHGVVAIVPGERSLEYRALDYNFEGTDELTYTLVDPAGASATASVTVDVVPRPTVRITLPTDGAVEVAPSVRVEFEVEGCKVADTEIDPGGCHLHKIVDGELYSFGDPGHDTTLGFYIGGLAPGEHTIALAISRNQPHDVFQPMIWDEVWVTVEE